MFAPYSLKSVNSLSDLPAGEYDGTCTVLGSADLRENLLILEFRHRASGELRALDVIYQDPQGLVRMRDFALMPDGTWRNSHGERSKALAELLPPEVYTYDAIAQFVLRTEVVPERLH